MRRRGGPRPFLGAALGAVEGELLQKSQPGLVVPCADDRRPLAASSPLATLPPLTVQAYLQPPSLNGSRQRAATHTMLSKN
eukprot:1343482-Amphidinium_carterae.1